MESPQLLLRNQICFPIYSASKLITRAYQPFLNEYGITYPQYLVLLVLWEQDGVSIKTITEQLMLETNTISPLLQRMEKLQFINRSRSKTDERTVIISLSAKGKKLKESAQSIPNKLMSTIVPHGLDLDELLALKSTMDQLIKTLKQNTNK